MPPGWKTYPLNLPPDLYAKASAAAEELGETLATWVRAAIREKLERAK